jgi:hypothetical protein
MLHLDWKYFMLTKLKLTLFDFRQFHDYRSLLTMDQTGKKHGMYTEKNGNHWVILNTPIMSL